MIEDEHQYVYATLILKGMGLNPDEVTTFLGINPSMSFKCGDKRGVTGIWKHNFWSLSSQEQIGSNNLAIHLEWLMSQLEPVESNLSELLDRKDIEGEISCFWILPTDHEIFTISPALLSKISMLNLGFSVDVYCP